MAIRVFAQNVKIENEMLVDWISFLRLLKDKEDIHPGVIEILIRKTLTPFQTWILDQAYARPPPNPDMFSILFIIPRRVIRPIEVPDQKNLSARSEKDLSRIMMWQDWLIVQDFVKESDGSIKQKVYSQQTSITDCQFLYVVTLDNIHEERLPGTIPLTNHAIGLRPYRKVFWIDPHDWFTFKKQPINLRFFLLNHALGARKFHRRREANLSRDISSVRTDASIDRGCPEKTNHCSNETGQSEFLVPRSCHSQDRQAALFFHVHGGEIRE